MKNLFGSKINGNDFDGGFYRDRKISPMLEARLEVENEELKKMEKKVTTPFWFQIAYMLLLGFGVIVIANVFSVMVENNGDISVPFNNAPGLVIAGIVALVLGLIMFIYSKLKAKFGISNEEVDAKIEKSSNINQECRDELGIPSDFVRLDVLLCQYKEDPLKPISIGAAKYVAFDMMAFIENNAIALADVTNVLLIPKDEVKRIYKKEKNVTFVGWTKEDIPVKNRYNGYKVVVQNNTFYTCGAIGIVLEHLGNEYEIICPIYEEDKVKELFGLDFTE